MDTRWRVDPGDGVFFFLVVFFALSAFVFHEGAGGAGGRTSRMASGPVATSNGISVFISIGAITLGFKHIAPHSAQYVRPNETHGGRAPPCVVSDTNKCGLLCLSIRPVSKLWVTQRASPACLVVPGNPTRNRDRQPIGHAESQGTENVPMYVEWSTYRSTFFSFFVKTWGRCCCGVLIRTQHSAEATCSGEEGRGGDKLRVDRSAVRRSYPPRSTS